MIEMIALLFPNVIGTYLIDKKEKLNNKEIILTFSILTMIVNMCISMFFYIKRKELFMTFTNMFFIKYICFSVILNIIFSVFYIKVLRKIKVVVEKKKK